MAALSAGLGHIVNRTKEKATEVKDTVNNPIETNEAAPEGERLRVLGYLVGERRSAGLTLVKACAAELIGTALFVLLSTGVVTSGCHTQNVASQSGQGNDTTLRNAEDGSCFLNNTSTLLNIAMAFGLALFVIIYFTASFSGGHINPAISLAMFLNRRISLLRCVLYIIFQVCGAMIGSVILKGLDPSGFRAAAGATNQINKKNNATIGTGLGYEIVITFGLAFTVFAATDSHRALSTAPLPILAPLAVGIYVLVAHLLLVPIDGCSINPARSTGPAVVARQFTDLWVFWVGPFIGAVIGSALYETAFKTKKKKGAGKAKDDDVNREDIESGIPIASNAQRAVHAGTAGLDEVNFAEDND